MVILLSDIMRLERILYYTAHMIYKALDSSSTCTDYDALDRPIQISDASGVTTTYGYDVRHRLTFIRHSKGDLLLAQYRYTLDATGQRLGLEETDAQGQIKVTTWDYDDAGRLIQETAPGRITTNMIGKTVNSGVTT